jgi:hypothetical protein
LPEIVTPALAATGFVVIENVAVVAPAATVTLAGTWAAALLLESVTTAPPDGAAPLSVTVPVEPLPPITLAGLTDTEESITVGAGITVKVTDCVVPYVPEIDEVVVVETALVVTLKVALDSPAAIVTLAGTWAAVVLLLERVTTAPPAGAVPLKVTVPVDPLPPTTLTGLTVTEASAVPPP